MKYEATYVPVQFWENFPLGHRPFEAESDERAIQYAENPESHPVPLRFVMPSGGTCSARIQKLWELLEEGKQRLVKEW